jgi:hypothetical protein
MKPNDVDIARVRRHPQRTKLYLGIFEPSTVLAAQANDSSLAQGAITIPYDNVTDGNFALIKEGMTMYVGSNPGGKDLGRIRVRSADASEITVAENDTIQWIDDIYLTVVSFFEPWGVYPRIVLDSEQVPTFYKDYDILYTDQNQIFDPVVHMGSHVARFIDEGSVNVTYSSSGTFDPTDESIPTGLHSWFFEGGNPTGALVAHPGLIEYTQSGHYSTHLEVSSNSGKTFEGHRHVMIFDRPGEGVNPPIMNFGFIGLEGSRKGGGYNGRFWVREPADIDKIVDGALVVLFTEDWYGTEKVSLGGYAVDRSNILFAGYIEDESIRYNSDTSRLEFRASSVTGIADIKHTFSATLEDRTNTSDWFEMQDMTIDKAIVHFLRWQTTLLAIADFNWSGDDKPVEFADFGRGTIYSEAQKLYESALGANLVADRQGTLWGEVDVNLMTTGTRSLVDYPEVMEIQRRDWLDEINFNREVNERLSFIEVGGIAYSGPVSGTFDPFLSGAPGDAPAYAGGVQRKSGLVLGSQTQLNEYAGLVLADTNSIYPRLDLTLAGDYRFIDVAPQEFILLTIEEDDTYRGIIWNKKRFVPQQISYNYDSREETLVYGLVLSAETHGPPGETIIIPVEPPYDPPDLPDFDIDFPPIIPPPIIPPPIDVPEGEGNTVYVVTENKLTRTRNFWDNLPSWSDITPAQTSVTGTYHYFRLDPFDPVNSAFLVTRPQGGIDAGDHIYRTANLDAALPTWTEILSPATIAATTGNPLNHNNDHIYQFGESPAGQGLMGCVTKGGDTLIGTVYGQNWFLRDNIDGGQGNESLQFLMWWSQHGTVLDIYVVESQAGEAFRSKDQGLSWTKVAPNGATDQLTALAVPFGQNPTDDVFYWSRNPGGASDIELFLTNDGGANDIDITPIFQDKRWGVKRIAFPDYGQLKLLTHPSNRFFCAFFLEGKSGASTDNQTTLFVSQDGGGSFFPRYQFIDGSPVGCAFWHPTNINKMYALGNSALTGYIFGSENAGLTWAQKIVSWENDIGTIGSPDFLGWAPIAIYPVWTA